MIPVDQTIFTPDNGDCMRACVASLLEWPLDRVPNFMETGPKAYERRLKNWADSYGITILDAEVQDHKAFLKAFRNTYLIGFGKSPRFDCDHAVIYRGRHLVHDPHPSKAGIKGKPKGFSLFVISDYQKFFKRYYSQQEEEVLCWLCGCSVPDPDTEITVECETPGGKPCLPKNVKVHYGCYLDWSCDGTN